MTDKIPLAGVIGSPVAHSLSPRLHNHWLRTYGLKGHYIPMEVAPEDLEQVLHTLPRMGFVGVNVTIPHKEAALALADVENLGMRGELMKFDVSKMADTEAVLGKWIEKNPDQSIEVLVNNAGIKKDNLMMWMSESEWHNVIDIAVDGFFNVTRTVLKPMLVKKYGRIVNVVSLSGLKGMPGQTNYSASKAAVIGATNAPP